MPWGLDCFPAPLRDWARRRQGWSRRGVAFTAGALSVLALAPFFLWPVLFLTLPVLVWLIDSSAGAAASNIDAPPSNTGPASSKTSSRRRPGSTQVSTIATPADPRTIDARRSSTVARWAGSAVARAAGAGWWFGFGYFVFGLFWLGEAFLVDAAKFAWLLPFAVTLMPAGLALFYAAATAAAVCIWRPGVSRILVLAITLGIAEWLRGHVLTGFPWNVLGYALTAPPTLMQAAGLIGIYGLTSWAVVIFAAPLVLAADTPGARPLLKRWLRPVTIAAVPLLCIVAYGSWQLARPTPPDADGVRFRVVQPSVPQREKWLPQNQRSIFDTHLALSQTNAAGETVGLAGITHVIWPEAAMPFFPLEHDEALTAIRELLGADTHLITGALRRATKPGIAPPAPGERLPYTAYDFFNSMMVFGGDRTGPGIYDKVHLVPFGEYLPMQGLLETLGIQQLTGVRGGFSVGPEPRPLLTAGTLDRMAPLICYEAVFPGDVVQGAERPRVLINVTNDGWFGNTTGPRQHLHQTRVRAVEEGVPIVRAANNGISAVIDADGRLTGWLDMNVKGVIEANLPGLRPPPPYARFGDWLFVVNLLIFCAFAGVLGRQRP